MLEDAPTVVTCQLAVHARNERSDATALHRGVVVAVNAHHHQVLELETQDRGSLTVSTVSHLNKQDCGLLAFSTVQQSPAVQYSTAM